MPTSNQDIVRRFAPPEFLLETIYPWTRRRHTERTSGLATPRNTTTQAIQNIFITIIEPFSHCVIRLMETVIRRKWCSSVSFVRSRLLNKLHRTHATRSHTRKGNREIGRERIKKGTERNIGDASEWGESGSVDDEGREGRREGRWRKSHGKWVGKGDICPISCVALRNFMLTIMITVYKPSLA